jgi:hypothetical protein
MDAHGIPLDIPDNILEAMEEGDNLGLALPSQHPTTTKGTDEWQLITDKRRQQLFPNEHSLGNSTTDARLIALPAATYQ